MTLPMLVSTDSILVPPARHLLLDGAHLPPTIVMSSSIMVLQVQQRHLVSVHGSPLVLRSVGVDWSIGGVVEGVLLAR